MAIYRFYLFDRHGHIVEAQEAGCAGAEEIERTARDLLRRAANMIESVEAWERDQRVYRLDRVNLDA
jgi:hypothetical protein